MNTSFKHPKELFFVNRESFSNRSIFIYNLGRTPVISMEEWTSDLNVVMDCDYDSVEMMKKTLKQSSSDLSD